MRDLLVTKGDTSLQLNSDNLDYTVVKNGYKWIGQGRRPKVYFQKKVFGKYIWIPKCFGSAGTITHKIVGDSIVSTYSNFSVLCRKLSLSLQVTAEILSDGKIDFSIEAHNESGLDIKAIFFPKPFNAESFDKSKAYTVDPMRQGFILPDTHRENRRAIFLLTKYWRKINSGDAYLPIWGRVCGEQGYAGIADDSYDATLYSCYGRGKSLLTSTCWMGSLGKLAYKRTIHYHFYDKCDYVTIAKQFRKQEIEQGKFISIDEKIKSNPKVSSLIGAPVIHWRIMEHNVPSSSIYKQCGVAEVLHNNFADTAELFRKYKLLGLNNAYVHTDGWGKRGYDNLHPYALPPGKGAGGWSGMKLLSDTCVDIGYKFGIHDQYRDYYQDCETYNPEHAVVDVNGVKSFCDVWAGGAHNWLCSALAKPYVERTYKEFKDNNIQIDGTYLDVFGIMWGDECYHKDHRITRKQSIEYRGEIFDMLRKDGVIVSSEEIGCQMVKYLDLVHHAPYAVTPQGGGVRVGVPIPLTNLVYHDSVFVPWHIEGKGGWGIPDGDAGLLHCILNGQAPYFNNSMASLEVETDEVLLERINSVNKAAEINAKVYNAELVSHKFLDKNYRIQQTEFSNGVVIKVDFDKDTYEIMKG